jgi:hypothetical protein
LENRCRQEGLLQENEMSSENSREERNEGKAGLRSWALVCGLALAFLLYGFFMFVIVGDKGPPGWDFTAVEDIPGKSVYSTFPEPGGTPKEPEPQHVSDKPAYAPVGKEKAGSSE